MSRDPTQGAGGEEDRTSGALSSSSHGVDLSGNTVPLAASGYRTPRELSQQQSQQGVDLSGNTVHTAATRIARAQEQWKQLLTVGARIATRPFDQLRRPVLSKANARTNEPWGDQITEKLTNITRVYCINLNGMTLDSRGGKFDTVCRCVKEVQADIFCGQEHKLDTTQHSVRTILFDTISQHWQRNRLVLGTSPIEFKTQSKPGGTMIFTTGALTSRVIKQVRDKWGRWVIQELRGQNNRKLVVMTVYQPIEKGGSQLGKITVEAQQISLLRQTNDTLSTPRAAFRRDLLHCIKQYQQESYDILITGDFNEVLGNERDGMSQIVSETGLIDLMAAHHPADPPPATYARGQKRLDYALASPNVQAAVKAAGYEAFDNRIASDHRGYFLDFDTAILFGSETQELATRHRRPLSARNAKQVTAYLREKHRLISNCEGIRRSRTLENPGNRHAFANRLDQDVLTASLQAEKRIPQFDAPVWSAALVRARQYVAILTKQLSALRTGLDHHRQLEIEKQALDKHYDSPLELPDTIPCCSTVLRQAKKAVAEIVASSTERQDQELQRRIKDLEQSANLHDRDVAIMLRRLKRAESLQQLFKKLRYVRGGVIRQGVTRLEIPLHPGDDPKACTEWRQIEVPTEIVTLLQDRNRQHFGQAKGTPFTVSPLAEQVGFTGTGVYSDQLLQGTYDDTEHAPNVRLLLKHLKQVHQMEASAMRPTITAAEFRGKLQVWSESTTTSPSGLHLGHYKALIAKHSFSSELPDDELTPEFCTQRDELNSIQEDLFQIHLRLINYALNRGTSYTRWHTIINTILFKDPDNVRLDRTRVIHIYEADYNLALGIKWRTATQHAEEFNLLNEGQYGSRTGRRATDPVLIEEMQYEISRATRKPLLLTHYDATACYDRIIPNLGMIVSQKFGVPAAVTQMNATTLEQATYLVRTELGVSRTGYTHCDSDPIFGTGQGSSNSPAIWLFVSSALMDAYEDWAKSATYATPTEDCSVDVDMVGFVDDNTGQTNDFFGENNRANINAIVDQAMKNAQHWFDLLGASGGALEYSKCCIHMMEWFYSKNGSPFLGMYEKDLQKRLNVYNSETRLLQRLTLLSAYKAHKTLGHYKEPAGSQQEQFRQLKKLSDESTAFLFKCPLTRHEAWTYYFACYLPSIGYTLPCSSLTRNKLEQVQKKAFPIIVARCGFNRNTHRAILYGPVELGGANFRHLYVQQGLGQVSEFIRNWRLKSTAGKLIRIALAWFQEQAGVSFPILTNVKVALPQLESKWIASLRDFLSTYDMHLNVTTPAIPKLQRMYDIHLMDMIQNSKQFTPSDVRKLNYCRLFLKAITLSDITHTTGTRLDGSKLAGAPSVYSSSRLGNSINQERPSDAEWKLWRRASRLWSDENGTLHQPLGP